MVKDAVSKVLLTIVMAIVAFYLGTVVAHRMVESDAKVRVVGHDF
jgi:hypothetical protein